MDYSVFDAFNNQSYFHPYCLITNYNNQSNVENCWLGDTTVSLPDLDTQSSAVQNIWYNWVGSLVSNYSSMIPSAKRDFHAQSNCDIVDGLRVDTVKHVQKDFWPGYNKAAGVYCVGEVFDGDPSYTCPYQDVMDGVLNYPL